MSVPAYQKKTAIFRKDKPQKPNNSNKLEKKCVAYCTSHRCNRTARGLISDVERKYGTIKDVPYHTVFCPVCGSALYWERQ